MREGTGKRKMKMSIKIRLEHELGSQEVSECLLNTFLFCSNTVQKLISFPVL